MSIKQNFEIQFKLIGSREEERLVEGHALLLTHNELFFRSINLCAAAAASSRLSDAGPEEEVNELRNQKA